MYSNKSYFIYGFGAGNIIMGHYQIGAHFGSSKKGHLFCVNLLFFMGKQSI